MRYLSCILNKIAQWCFLLFLSCCYYFDVYSVYAYAAFLYSVRLISIIICNFYLFYVFVFIYSFLLNRHKRRMEFSNVLASNHKSFFATFSPVYRLYIDWSYRLFEILLVIKWGRVWFLFLFLNYTLFPCIAGIEGGLHIAFAIK